MKQGSSLLQFIQGFLIDLDGTVYQDGIPLPGSIETLALLRERSIPFRLVTNTTRRSAHEIRQQLSGMSVQISPEELFTPLRAASQLLKQRGMERIALLAPANGAVDLDVAEILPPGERGGVDAVIVGDLGSRWTYEILDAAFHQLQRGAGLIALQKNRYWNKEGALHIDAGPFVAALEYAAGSDAVIVGKPSHTFFDQAAQSMGCPLHQLAMIGDDIESDVAGMQQAGGLGLLVQTGKYRVGIEEATGVEPDAILTSLAAVNELLV